MYSRLAKLLRFSRISRHHEGGRVLTCHREYTFLERTTCRLNGHYVQIQAYESGLGELFLTVFVFRYSAFLTLLVDEKRRHDLLANAALDPVLEEPVRALSLY